MPDDQLTEFIMTLKISFVIILLCTVLPSIALGQQKEHPVIQFEPGKQIANSLNVSSQGEKRELGFWLYVPKNYQQADSLPWMMFLHGMGERGDDLELVKKWGPPKRVGEDHDFPFILISPQCPGDIRWQVEHLVQLMDAVEAELKVDRNRFYLTGLSMGGYGTWSMLAHVPERIAAAVPVCGGGNPERAGKMINVPIWAFHGDDDKVVRAERSKVMVEAVQKAGGNAKLTLYEGVGHNSWSPTYSNEKVYKWMLNHSLNSKKQD